MTTKPLTAGEKSVLIALNAAEPDKSLPFATLRLRCNPRPTSRGFSTIVSRLERDNRIARNFAKIALTFGGTRALREAGVSVD
jgi:hypothetical protein